MDSGRTRARAHPAPSQATRRCCCKEGGHQVERDSMCPQRLTVRRRRFIAERMISNKGKSDKQATLFVDANRAVPKPIDRLIETFRGELAGVHFPDVGLDELEKAAGAVRAKATELESLRQQVVAVEVSLQEEQAALAALAARGLAYARVYAAAHPKLAASLSEIRLADAPIRKSRKQRNQQAPVKEPDARTDEGVHLVAVV